MKTRMLPMVAATIAAFGVALLPMATASAAPPPACPAGTLCLWGGTNYTGGELGLSGGGPVTCANLRVRVQSFVSNGVNGVLSSAPCGQSGATANVDGRGFSPNIGFSAVSFTKCRSC